MKGSIHMLVKQWPVISGSLLGATLCGYATFTVLWYSSGLFTFTLY